MPPLFPRCTLETPLRELEWIGAPRLRALERVGLVTAGDLLRHYPKRYEDRTRFDHFPSGETDQPVCVCGMVKKVQLRRFRGYQRMFDAVLEEQSPNALSEPLTLRWFNSPWVEKAIIQGQRIVVFGKPKLSKNGVVISHPEFEVVDDDADVSVHLNRIAPVHRATEGVTVRVIRRLVWDVLARFDDSSLETLLPKEFERTTLPWALRQIHFPDDHESLAKARRHLVMEEFFVMQLAVGAKRAETQAEPGGAHCGPGALMQRLHELLPFPLTGAQRRAIEEIRYDLASSLPMNRLLHGDVGSGKTLVALSAMLLCVESGYQAALMAPTQILAEQHYLNLRKWCTQLGLTVALRTGNRREDSEEPLFAGGGGAGSTGCQPVASGSLPEDRGPGKPTAKAGISEPTYHRRHLPHFERPWAKYMITFACQKGRMLSGDSRDVVMEAIRHWCGIRYELYAACVMPDHVHMLIEPKPKSREDGNPEFFDLSTILHSIKSFTANRINEVEQQTGSVWGSESFDRIIRSESDLQEKFGYIIRNPWTAEIIGKDDPYPWIWHPWLASPDLAAGCREGQAGSLSSPSKVNLPAFPPGEPHLFVGTHALLYERAGISRLGLAVIDEQHKFGVMQRARLREQGTAPDVLVMTATPIPRTLTMTLYGDLDVSTLDELPKGRGKIVTAVRDEKKLPDAVKFMREHLEAGRQAYVVYPLIDESEKLEAKAAAAEFAKWQEFLAPMKCELLHGRVPPEEKDAIMERFRSGESKALIATTVIEVGIDVPNASLMLIENAERFGLAQIHQLRGRVGRGEHKSYCILLTGAKADEEAKAKLAILEKSGNGFDIAEEDLRLRGPGDILGTAQSGLPPLKIGDLFADADLMKLARNAAFMIFERDPRLEKPEHARYRKVLADTRRAVLSQVS